MTNQDCEDDNKCTLDTCSTSYENGGHPNNVCHHIALVCPEGGTCDPSTGLCHTLGYAKLPSQVRFIYQMDPQDPYNDPAWEQQHHARMWYDLLLPSDSFLFNGNEGTDDPWVWTTASTYPCENVDEDRNIDGCAEFFCMGGVYAMRDLCMDESSNIQYYCDVQQKACIPMVSSSP